jgi:hypothetical protein
LWWLLLWGAWAVRLWHLAASDLTFDEAATYFVAHRPLPDILAYLRGAVREHPPVYYLLMRLWLSVAGTSEFSLRFFAAGASLIGVALTSRLARKLAGMEGLKSPIKLFIAAFSSALVLATFPLEVYYARDARMYTLAIVWVLWSSLLFLPLLFGRTETSEGSGSAWPRPQVLLGLVFLNGLALFTHYYLLLFIVTQFVTLLLLRRWRALLAWSGAHGLVGLMGVIWLARSPGLSSSLSEAWGRFALTLPSVGKLRRLLAELLFGPITGVPWNLIYGWAVLVIVGLVVAWWWPGRVGGQRNRTGRGGLWLTVSVLLPVALSFLMPEPPRSRYLIFLLPFMALALGQLPLLFADRRRMVFVWSGFSVLTISSLGVFGLPRTVNWIKSRYGHTIDIVSAYARPGDGVIFYGPWQAIQFHYYQPDEFPPVVSLPRRAPPQLVPEEAEPVLRDLLSAYQRLWVIPAAVDDVDPGHYVEDWLENHAHLVWSSHESSLYLPPADQVEVQLPEIRNFDGGLRLDGLTSDGQAVPAGEGLRFTTVWSVSEPLDRKLKLDLSLMDERGVRWLQWDRGLGQGSNPSKELEVGRAITHLGGLVVPQGAPVGRYTVQMAVLDAMTGETLKPSDGDQTLSYGTELFSLEVVEPVTAPVLMDVGDFGGPFRFEPPAGETGHLMLMGYDLGGLTFQQGHSVPLRLHWLAPEHPGLDLQARLRVRHRSWSDMLGDRAAPLFTETLSLVPGYPMSEWSSGRLVSLPAAIPLPSDATPGEAELVLTLVDSDNHAWTVAGGTELSLGRITIQERQILRELPTDLTAVEVDFGDIIGLRGYRIEGEVRPGGQLELYYAWYVLERPQHIYSVFNHLLTPAGQKLEQADGWPQGGAVLTNQWRPGEYIQDHHTIVISPDAPAGPYLLAVGLYDASTGTRLSATQGGQPMPNDQWLLTLSSTSD